MDAMGSYRYIFEGAVNASSPKPNEMNHYNGYEWIS
jgi:hypothetical protein